MLSQFLFLAGFAAFLVSMCVIRVPEGHECVFFRGGALLNTTSPPGFVFKLPLITSSAFVQTTMQTDEVLNIPCGTRGGVLIHFDKIEVVNQLSSQNVISTTKNYGLNYDKIWIFDKIHHEINEFCSKHTIHEVYISLFSSIDESLALSLSSACEQFKTGIKILGVRVTKPKLPPSLVMNYEKMELEKTQLLVATEERKVIEARTETEGLIQRIQAETKSGVSRIQWQAAKAMQEAHANISTIEDEMHLAREKTLSDAETYRRQTETTGNQILLSPNYLRWKKIQAKYTHSSLVMGDAIPSYFPASLLPATSDMDATTKK